MDSSSLIETQNFYVVIAPMAHKDWAGLIGYRLVNKRTDVVEAETNSEAHAIRLVHTAEKNLADVLADPDGAKEREKLQQRVAGGFLRDLQMPDDSLN